MKKKIFFKCIKWINILRNFNEFLMNYIKIIVIEKNKKIN